MSLQADLDGLAKLLRAVTKQALRDAKRGDVDAQLYVNHVFRNEDSTMQHNARTTDAGDLVELPMPDILTGEPVLKLDLPVVKRRQFAARPLAVNVADLVPLAMPDPLTGELPKRTPAQPVTNWKRGFVANTQPTGWIGSNE